MDKKEIKMYLEGQKQKATFSSKTTVNWVGKKQRGLSETAIEALMKNGEASKADELKKQYKQLANMWEKRHRTAMPIADELNLVRNFCIVKTSEGTWPIESN